jgi:alkylhydroperoxidase family enzyme
MGDEVTAAVLENWREAPIRPELKATLGFLEKLTLHPDDVTSEDADAVRRAGVSEEALEDAIYVCVIFSVLVRLADAMGWRLPPEESHRRSASMLLKLGYAFPPPLAWLSRLRYATS